MNKPILIVGQGLAGTLLAHAFHEAKIPAHIMDADAGDASSLVAAGIINPVTGKRYAMSWMYDTFFPEARATYLALQRTLDIKIWHEKKVIKLLDDISEYNNWVSRSGFEEYQAIMSVAENAGAWQPYICQDFQYGLLSGAAQVNLSLLLGSWREKATTEGKMLLHPLPYNETEKLLREYQSIVFCEGYKGKDNPFFPNLPWKPAKGEVLHLQIDEKNIPTEEFPLLKHNLLIAQQSNNNFWVGANYQWDYADALPTVAARQYLETELQTFMHVPYKIIAHKAGIRPATTNRRPLLERSTQNPRIFMFNGLGAKGTLLGPYWAKKMAEKVINNE